MKGPAGFFQPALFSTLRKGLSFSAAGSFAIMILSTGLFAPDDNPT